VRVREGVASYDAARRPRLRRGARNYGNVRTKKFFSEALSADMAPRGGPPKYLLCLLLPKAANAKGTNDVVGQITEAAIDIAADCAP
jgi:hypothetical protein